MNEPKVSLKDIPSLVKESFKEWMDDEPFDLSAIVAYYSIFSLPALLIIIITIAGAAFGQEAVQGKIAEQIGSMMGKEAGTAIQTMIAEASKKQNSTIATIIGIATLLFGATGVFSALQKSLNKIWEVKPDPKKGGIKKLILDRSASFGLIIVIGFLLLISLVLTSLLAILSEWIQSKLPDFLLYIFYVLNFAVTFGIIMLVFAMIYKILPDAKIKWKSVWIGASVTAFLFVLGKFALGFYFSKADPGSAYGAAGSVILILLWVSYSCLILFFGAEFTQVYARKFIHDIEPSDHAIRSED